MRVCATAQSPPNHEVWGRLMTVLKVGAARVSLLNVVQGGRGILLSERMKRVYPLLYGAEYATDCGPVSNWAPAHSSQGTNAHWAGERASGGEMKRQKPKQFSSLRRPFRPCPHVGPSSASKAQANGPKWVRPRLEGTQDVSAGRIEGVVAFWEDLHSQVGGATDTSSIACERKQGAWDARANIERGLKATPSTVLGSTSS